MEILNTDTVKTDALKTDALKTDIRCGFTEERTSAGDDGKNPAGKRNYLLRAAIVLIYAVRLLWPLPFSDLMTDEAGITIRIPSSTSVSTAGAEYTLYPGTEEFAELRRIMGKYSYHWCFQTFFGYTGMSRSWHGDGFHLNIMTARNQIMGFGAKKVAVNGRVYKIGYWGNGTAMNMMNEIQSFLKENFDAESGQRDNGQGGDSQDY